MNRPPLIKNAPTPFQILGDLFQPFCLWIQHCAGQEHPPKLKDDDAARMSKCLNRLEVAGWIVGDPRTGNKLDTKGNVFFSQRAASATDEMFNDNKTYGGVPPIKELKKMSSAECRKIFNKLAGGIG